MRVETIGNATLYLGDGYQRVRDVRGWCEVPAVDLDDESDWPTRGTHG